MIEKEGRGLVCPECTIVTKAHHPLLTSRRRGIQRDRNAALNIQHCLKTMIRTGQRPLYLTPIPKTQQQ